MRLRPTPFSAASGAVWSITKISLLQSENGLTLSSMRGLDYNDPKWESYLDQIDWEGDKDSILLNHTGAAYTLGAISSLGIPSTVQEDGANGLKVQGSDNDYDMSKSSSSLRTCHCRHGMSTF